MTWKSVVREFVPPVVMQALRRAPPPTNPYISASETIAAAQAAGLTVCDYLERLWGQEGRTASIISRLAGLGAISAATKTIIEIGPGTGRYIEHTLKYCTPEHYQIYETDKEWSDCLSATYPIEACVTDGHSLRSSQSADLIMAHNVFTYVPFLTSYRYFEDMALIGKYLAFDIISEDCLDPKTINSWIKSRTDWPRFLSKKYVLPFFESRGFQLIDSFRSVVGAGLSEYLVLLRVIAQSEQR